MLKISWLIISLFLAFPSFKLQMHQQQPVHGDVKEIEALLSYVDEAGPNDLVDPRKQLIAMGEKVFPTYQAILAKPKDFRQLVRIFELLCHTKGNRQRFLEPAVNALQHPKYSVRLESLMLLREIGTSAEGSPIIALLSDKEFGLVKTAAETLAAIGGPREVIAMDVWLNGITRQDDAEVRKHVKECRDALQKRLDNTRAKKK